jgi:hypothetical protein
MWNSFPGFDSSATVGPANSGINWKSARLVLISARHYTIGNVATAKNVELSKYQLSLIEFPLQG